MLCSNPYLSHDRPFDSKLVHMNEGTIQEARHVHEHPVHGTPVHGPPDRSLDIEFSFIVDYYDIINFFTFLRRKLHSLSHY